MAALVQKVRRLGRLNSPQKLADVAGPMWSGAADYYEVNGAVIVSR